jgi:hypothetical protein
MFTGGRRGAHPQREQWTPVPPFETLRPAPPVPPPAGSLVVWVCLVIALIVVVAAGVVLASRH